ncbi:MAG TPA: hypothetical protein VFD06_02355 [Candidatus Polarisedimenticolia bacterium]|nr:hypothetical protein [Candidatus Polarisedimenticolia bacterium]
MRCVARIVLAASFAALACGCGGGRDPGSGEAGNAPFLVVSNRGGAWRVYETGRDGRGARLVGSPRADEASYTDTQPARLPDGAIAFVSDRGGRPALWLRPRGAEEARPVLGMPAAAGGAAPNAGTSDSDPAPFGADGIVFARAEDPGGGADPAQAPATVGRDLYLARRDGTGLRRLTTDPADDGAPCVLPDGRSIVFASARRGGPELFRLDASAADPEATAAPLRSLDRAVSDDAPACLPDGSILFARSTGGGPSQVFQARFTDRGLAARQITDAATLPYGAGEPVPLADGTILLTAGPGPANGGPRYAVYGISGGGYNLARVTRERAGYEDLTRRLRPPR